MLKEYRTIREVVGPLMLVDRCEGVTYDELVEIEQANGEIRRGKVLEINGDKALVQLFESSNGLQIATAKARFLGQSHRAGRVAWTCSAACSTAWATPSTAAPQLIPDKRLDINGAPMNPAARDYPNEFIQTGISRHRRPEHAGARPEAARVLRLRPAARAARRADRAPGEGAGRAREVRRGVRRDRHHVRRSGLLHQRFPQHGRHRAHGAVHQPRQRPGHRAHRHAAHGADRRRIPGLREGHARAGHPHRHDQLRRGAARGVRRAQGSAGPPRLSRLSVHRPCQHVRARGPHQGPEGLHHADPDPHHAGGRQDPPDPRPDRLHHRRADHPLAASCTARASRRRSTCCRRSRA